MRIAENILKHSLQNVYFLSGTACGGKTTMANALSEKYGFFHYNDNWHEPYFAQWQSLCDERYQPRSSVRKQVTDWEAYFGRSVEQFLSDNAGYTDSDEYLEFILIELIKISQTQKVVADIWAPIPLIAQLADYNRIACLLAPTELVIRDYYGREDHREFFECIMSLTEPEKKLETQNELFRISGQKIFDDARECNLFSIVRSEQSTVENTLRLLDAHFGLTNG